MKVNKLFGVKSITNLLYGMLLMLPFVSVLSRVIYVQANPSAKDSYSDSSLIESISELTSLSQLENAKTYSYQYIPNTNQSATMNQIWFSELSFNLSDKFPQMVIRDYVCFQTYGTGNAAIWYYYNDNNTLTSYYYGNIRFDFSFVSSNQYSQSTGNIYRSKITTITYVKSSLDNAFDYSLQTFVEDYDNESINFFGWFTDLFLNQNKPHNALYLNFANWYMNYTLLVSTGYLLFFALLWFINYVRKILEKSSYHDFGGF